MKKTIFRNKLWLSLLIYFSLSPPLASQIEENLIKAVFFQRFAEFTTWPSTSLIQDKTKPFVIGLFEKSSFSLLIEKTYAQKTIFNKKVKIKYITGISDADNCHIVYIPKSYERNLESILSYTRNKPILTIGDTKGYARKGVHINLYTLDQSVRFEINEAAVRISSLHMSHLLLDFANIVTYQEL